MTEQERLNFEKCNKFERCNVPVCPLYINLKDTRHIAGDRRCSKIIDYLDNTEMPDDLRSAIAESEPLWRSVLSDALLDRWIKARTNARKFFHKAA